MRESPEEEIVITLASASPQRAAMLSDLGFPLLQHPQHIDETLLTNHIEEESLRLARLKAESCMLQGEHSQWIVGVDTLAGIGSSILGKPSCRDEARETLAALQGARHTVSSGIALFDTKRKRSVMEVISTEVDFAPMTPEEIDWYLDTLEWNGAAGAYRIQGRGGLFIHALKGSYPNVVGLPIHTFYGMLRSFNYPFQLLKR
jgi:septum formation protein